MFTGRRWSEGSCWRVGWGYFVVKTTESVWWDGGCGSYDGEKTDLRCTNLEKRVDSREGKRALEKRLVWVFCNWLGFYKHWHVPLKSRLPTALLSLSLPVMKISGVWKDKTSRNWGWGGKRLQGLGKWCQWRWWWVGGWDITDDYRW